MRWRRWPERLKSRCTGFSPLTDMSRSRTHPQKPFGVWQSARKTTELRALAKLLSRWNDKDRGILFHMASKRANRTSKIRVRLSRYATSNRGSIQFLSTVRPSTSDGIFCPYRRRKCPVDPYRKTPKSTASHPPTD